MNGKTSEFAPGSMSLLSEADRQIDASVVHINGWHRDVRPMLYGQVGNYFCGCNVGGWVLHQEGYGVTNDFNIQDVLPLCDIQILNTQRILVVWLSFYCGIVGCPEDLYMVKGL